MCYDTSGTEEDVCQPALQGTRRAPPPLSLPTRTRLWNKGRYGRFIQDKISIQPHLSFNKHLNRAAVGNK